MGAGCQYRYPNICPLQYVLCQKCPVNVLNKSEICPSQVFLLILNSLLSFCRQIVQYSTFVPAFDSYMSSTFHKNVSKKFYDRFTTDDEKEEIAEESLSSVVKLRQK